MLLFSLSFGVGKGFLYPTALEASWSHLPGRKGFVTGFVTSGVGFGSFIFNIVGTRIVNPNNLGAKPSIVGFNDDGRPVIEYFFGANVNSRMPMMI